MESWGLRSGGMGSGNGIREMGYREWDIGDGIREMGLWDYGVWVDVCDCQDGSGDFEADVVAGE